MIRNCSKCGCNSEVEGTRPLSKEDTCPICGHPFWVVIGKEVTCKVEKVTQFGIFVTFGDGEEGLIYLSELSSKKITHAAEVVKPGQTIQAKILGIMPTGKIVLTCRKHFSDRF
jgi:predicted RNA-binding protein (virulence factor B family)